MAEKNGGEWVFTLKKECVFIVSNRNILAALDHMRPILFCT